MKIITLLFGLLFSLNLLAQQDSYYDSNHIRYDNYVYSNRYKSVELYKTGDHFTVPIIELNSKNTITLSFDDMEAQSETYYYTFILCNADWTPADLLPMEYIDGMTEDYFNSNSVSFNTTTQYTHYSTIIPSENIKITKAGNYILEVYHEGEADQPIITRRMYVVENRVGVVTQYFIAKAPQYSETMQEMYVRINLQSYSMPNVYQNFTLVVQQNGRQDNRIVRHQPQILTNEYMYFNLNNDILFDGGNEFRMVDIRSLNTPSSRVRNINFNSGVYHVNLLTDRSRAHNSYLRYHDLDGNFAIIDWDNPVMSQHVESDYALVNFSLKLDSVCANGGVYVMGAFTDWQFDGRSRMVYDKLTQTYTKTMMLKQGVYNYQYIYLPNTATEGNVAAFEGNHSATENTYTVFVYYRDQGDNWDKLLGYQTFQLN